MKSRVLNFCLANKVLNVDGLCGMAMDGRFLMFEWML